MSPLPADGPPDQRVAYDELRDRSRVVRDAEGTWTIFRHADVVRAALDPDAFSSRVSSHLNIPNGMDGAEHARFRALVERYLTPGRVARLEPSFRDLASELVRSLPRERTFDAVRDFGARYAVRAQSIWLGWPAELEDTLLGWMEDNRAATRSKVRARTAAVAAKFDEIIRTLIDSRRTARDGGAEDVTTELALDTVDGRPLRDEEIISILRNWTGGDLGSIASCLGVVVHHLASEVDLQDHLRGVRGAPEEVSELDSAIDEILRIDDPFVSNRRVTTTAVVLGDHAIPAGQRIVLNWTAANRDPRVMGDPDAYRPDENAAHNLVYGIGPHVCPGRGLSALELRIAVEELLAATTRIELAPDSEPVREVPPVGGYRTVPVLLR